MLIVDGQVFGHILSGHIMAPVFRDHPRLCKEVLACLLQVIFVAVM